MDVKCGLLMYDVCCGVLVIMADALLCDTVSCDGSHDFVLVMRWR